MPSPVNVSEVHLESVVAEVCFSSPSWLDGPGTESALLMEVEGEGHNGRKSLILAPQEIPDISGYQWGFGCQFVKAYITENPVTNQKIL